MDSPINLPINPGRVLFGLSRIGYTPESAVCDIVDNAVAAHAKNINILIRKREAKTKDTLRNNVLEYIIIDDGKGMNESGILNALTLGASEVYEPHSLSKFGLGLKSAAFSQGDELDLISSPGDGAPFLKYRVSLPSITDTYFATRLDLSADDEALIAAHLPERRGTVVRVGEVRREGHPAVRDTLDLLRYRVGVIYYYFMLDGALTIRLEGKALEPVDVLFTAEADQNGNLDDTIWNGRETRWLQKPIVLPLDAETGVTCTLEATQLPHPPTFTADGRGQDKIKRDFYRITAKNYGYYVYRNKRLIAWADSLDGMIQQDQDLYSFRGRILINDTADNVFNIDVKKTSMKLSEEAWDAIFDRTKNYKRNSMKAWNRATMLKKEAEAQDANRHSNDIIALLNTPESLPGQPVLSPTKNAEADEKLSDSYKANVQQQAEQAAAMKAAVQGAAGDDAPPKNEEEQFEETLKGDPNPYLTKIFRVPSLPDNQLWEPYYDAEHEYCVRINRYHRFAKLLFEENANNSDMQVLFELFLHQLSVAEVQFRKLFHENFPSLKLNDDKVEKLTSEFRKYAAGNLAYMCGRLDDKLPRNE
ncbi:MAG: ATP-binding protein [Bacteroidota bacterium]|nr:ATP-binding protein [Bacteroidota bacterium]